MRRFAPAKINLSLHIVGKRPDGYHDLASVMQQISIYDELEFRKRPKGISLACPGSDLPVCDNNLVFRAAWTLFQYAGVSGGVDIILKKNIPTAAGLGGGSSDAATTLMAINDLYDLRISQTELMALGAKLGADVPFFIFAPLAFATGIGDRLQTLPALPALHLVLVKPAFGLSTKMVYENLNLTLTKKKNSYSIPRFYALGDVIRELHNDLEAVSIRLHPELNEFKQLLIQEGALGAMMSGSGPTLFGIFQDEQSAQSAKAALDIQLSSETLIVTARSIA